MAVSDGRQIVVFKDLGLVSQVFDEQTLSSLRGHLAVGHTRYSTTGSPTWENAQPTFRTTAAGTGLALGHNGNLVNTAELVRRRDAALAVNGGPRNGHGGGNRRSSALVGATTDSDVVTGLLADAAADLGVEEAALRAAARPRGRLQHRLLRRDHALRRPRPPRRAPARAGPSRPRLGRRLRDRRPRHRRGVVRPRGRARRAHRHRRRGPAQLAVRRAGAQGLHLRVRLPRPPGHLDLRPWRALGARRDRAPPRRRAPGRGGPRHPRPGVRDAGRHRLRRGLGHPVRPGPGQERLRGPHVHPALADHPPAGHPAQAQPAARGHPRQAPRRRRRLDRPRQHPALARADAARGRRARGARPHREPARALALLLRHRLRLAGRAHRQRPRRRGRAPLRRRRQPRLHLAGGPRRGHRPAALAAVHGVLLRRVPDPAARRGDGRQAPARGRHRRELRRRRLGRTRACSSTGARTAPGCRSGRRDTVPRTRSAVPDGPHPRLLPPCEELHR